MTDRLHLDQARHTRADAIDHVRGHLARAGWIVTPGTSAGIDLIARDPADRTMLTVDVKVENRSGCVHVGASRDDVHADFIIVCWWPFAADAPECAIMPRADARWWSRQEVLDDGDFWLWRSAYGASAWHNAWDRVQRPSHYVQHGASDVG